MYLTKRMTALALLLVLCFSLLSLDAAAADPVLSYDRYDGVKTVAYEGEWSTYSVKVDNVPAGAEISYFWQFTIKCAEADADKDACGMEWHIGWFDADEHQSWFLRNYENSPSIEVYNKEGDASVDDANRYVFRCTVKINGKKYKSPVFEQHCMAATAVSEIRAGGVDSPVAGGTPDFDANPVTASTSIESVQWFRIDSNGYASEIYRSTPFQQTGNYQLRVNVRLAGGIRLPSVENGNPAFYLNGSRCLGEYSDDDLHLVSLVRSFSIKNGTVTAVPYEYNIDSVLQFDEDHQYPDWKPVSSVQEVDVVANGTATFQCAAKRLPDGAVREGYRVEISFFWYDTSWHEDAGESIQMSDGCWGKQLHISTGAVGQTRTVVEILNLYRNGNTSPSRQLSRTFRTTAVEGLPPRLWRCSRADLVRNVGESAMFFCSASGDDNRYQWMAYKMIHSRYGDHYGWEPQYSGGSSILNYDAVTKEMNGWIFKCRVTNNYGETYSPEVTLYVNGTVCGDVTVTGITPPAAGGSPVRTGASVTNGTAEIPDGTVGWVRADNPAAASLASDADSFRSSVSPLEENAVFEAGHTYYAVIYPEAAGDYRFVRGKTRVFCGGVEGTVIYLTGEMLCAVFPYTVKCSAGSCPTGAFADVPPASNWAHEGIDFCVESGIMGSTSQTAKTFEPGKTCSRAEIASILYRLAGSPDIAFKGRFTDVRDGQWYTKAVLWCSDNGIVNGVDNGNGTFSFKPNDKVTREQLAVMLEGFAGFRRIPTDGAADLSIFADASKVTWSKAAVAWAVSAGIISGKTQNGRTYLDPQGTATRQEVASILMRFVQKVL